MEKAHIPLSQRIRPDSEAPWVIEQVIQLENTIYSLQHQLDISVAFHKVAIKERDFERSRVEILQTEVERLRGLLPPTAHAGVRNGPGEGSWSVYAGKLAEERDTALAEAERLRAELAEAKAASVLPVGITDLELSESGHRIEFYLEGDKSDGEKMLVWLRQKIGNGITGGQGE